MTIQYTREGALISQHEEGMTEHSVFVERYIGHIQIMQGEYFVMVCDSHVKQLIKVLQGLARDIAAESGESS